YLMYVSCLLLAMLPLPPCSILFPSLRSSDLDAIVMLFLIGLGLIYLILGTQFRSYWQPLLVLVSIPLAFTGVILGLYITGNPLSLYTLYAVVALSGSSVNTSIVLVSAANNRLQAGMLVLHAT